MKARIVTALALCGAFVACGSPESIRPRLGGASGSPGTAGMTNVAGNTGLGGEGGTPGLAGDTGSQAGMGGVPGTGGIPAAGGTGGTPATGGMGGTAATGGTGGTPTGGTGGKAGAGGTGGTPTGGTAGTPTGGTGGTPTGGTGGKAGAGGTGGVMVGGGPSIKLDAGSLTAMGAWAADMYFAPAPGNLINHTNTIDVSKVTNPAPAAVYQTARSGTNLTYTVPGYKANTMHTVRLHFCETYFPPSTATMGPGARVCSVTINGNPVLPNYDIFVKAGGKNIAIAEQFVLAADATGQYVMTFVRSSDNCLVAGIEID
jgi:Malectin domain